jgi:hypothetical protein
VGTLPASGSIDYEVTVHITADDQWEGYVDGVSFTAPYWNTWSTYDSIDFPLSSGDHVLAVHATDIYTVVSGLLVAVEVDGSVAYTSGTSDFLFKGTNPGSGWYDPSFSDSSWATSLRCSDTSSWGGQPAGLVAMGPEWVWDNSDCRTLGETWFRLHIRLP